MLIVDSMHLAPTALQVQFIKLLNPVSLPKERQYLLDVSIYSNGVCLLLVIPDRQSFALCFNLLLFPCCVDSACYELPKLDRYKVKCVEPQPLLEMPMPYHTIYLALV